MQGALLQVAQSSSPDVWATAFGEADSRTPRFRPHRGDTFRVTVTELLRLAPFSLGTITILLAAGGLLFGHAYGRYGDDAANAR
jgi:hypothetical protein